MPDPVSPEWETARVYLAAKLRDIETLCEELREVVDIGREALNAEALRERIAAVADLLQTCVECAAKEADLIER